MRAISIHVESVDSAVKDRQERVAEQVRRYFEAHSRLPDFATTLCYLADQDYEWIKRELCSGPDNRGIHVVIGTLAFRDWPHHIRVTAATDPTSGEIETDPISREIVWPYDTFIYLHGSTCSTDIGLAMTLAHELQHFAQYANQHNLWKIHCLLMNLPGLPRESLQTWSDFPAEIEARIVSKRVAETIFSRDAVQTYIQGMISRAPLRYRR